jgi:PilZ domain
MGRMERRLPIIVVVSLTRAERQSSDEDQSEKTYTDNISLHGARFFSRSPWEPGEMVRLTPLKYDCACGKVVYCQHLADGRQAVGVNFQDRAISWSILQRFCGA